MIIFTQIHAHDLSVDQIVEILQGSGPLALDFANGSIPVDQVYSAFPECESTCNEKKPCVRRGGKTCATTSSFTDTTKGSFEFRYCPKAFVCCSPPTCRPRVVECTQDLDAIVSRLEQHIDTDALKRLEPYGSQDAVDKMLQELSSPDILSEKCTQDCNNWESGVGDITLMDCPTSCVCSVVTQANLVSSGDFVCRKTNGRFSRGNKRLSVNQRTVCEQGAMCTNVTKCMTYEEYLHRPTEQIGGQIETDQAAINATSSGGLSTLAIVVIVVGFSVLVLIIIALLFKRSYYNTAEDDLLSDNEAGDEISSNYSQL